MYITDQIKKVGLHEFFTSLPQDPDEIAKWLRQRGYKGKRNSGRLNPLAKAVQDHADTWAGASVVPGSVCFHDIQIMDYHKMPAPVTLFLKRFNGGDYPELEK